MKRNEMKLLLEERFERIALLETRIDTMDQLIEGYRGREQAILDTLQAAKDNAAQIAEQAQQEAEETLAAAKRDAKALYDETVMTTEELKTEAEHLVKEMLSGAKAESERLLRDAEIVKREYEEMFDSFNAMLEQNASELQTSAARFGEFLKHRKIEPPETGGPDNAFYKSVGALSEESLPDPGDDPARLMQNIYRMQNRPVPEDRAEVPESTAERADGGEPEQKSETEPYSEAAWSNEELTSESEPQAEFTKSFNDSYTDSDFTVRADGCHLEREDTEKELDAFLTAAETTLDKTEAPDVAKPLADESSAMQQPGGVHADAQSAFDDYFHESLEPGGVSEPVEEAPVQAKEAYETTSFQAEPEPEPEPEFTPFQAEEAQEINPAPYSEAAWAHRILESEREAQAEFASAFAMETVGEDNKAAGIDGEDGARAFDEFFDSTSESEPSIEPEQTQPAVQPEPFSEAAWSFEAYMSEKEPQAEFNVEGEAEILGDDASKTQDEGGGGQEDGLVSGASETGITGEPAAMETDAAPEAVGGMELPEEEAVSDVVAKALDDMIPETESDEEEPAIMETDAAPEAVGGTELPEEETVSDVVAQAVDEMLPETENDEEETASTPRLYNEYGEPREWEPEMEPEAGDVPTVSDYLGSSGESEEISLDDLLNEIINAGE